MNPLVEAFMAKHYKDEGFYGTTFGSLLEDFAKFLCPYDVKIGGIYQHFKGNKYIVLGFVRDADDWEGEIRVRYVQINDVTHEAIRPLSYFKDSVEKPDYQGPRFKLVE